jgi:hypothetical protein
MSTENPLWGAPRIHGELLKLGFEVAESTVFAVTKHPTAEWLVPIMLNWRREMRICSVLRH